MASNIEILNIASANEKELKAIESFVLECESATIFHLPQWNRLVSEELGVKRFYAIAHTDEGITGLCPFDVVKLGPVTAVHSGSTAGDTVYGGPLVNPESVYIARELLRKIEEVFSPGEVWMALGPMVSAEPFLSVDFGEKLDYETNVIDLSQGLDDVMAQFDKKRRSGIRRAEKLLEIEILDGNNLQQMYELWMQLCNRAELSLLPMSFYQRVITELGQKDLSRGYVARENGVIVGSVIVLSSPLKACYWLGVSNKQGRSVGATELLLWNAMVWAAEKGCRQFDMLKFSRERIPGIAKFKLKFGGEVMQLRSVYKRSALGSAARGFTILRQDPKAALDRLMSGFSRLSRRLQTANVDRVRANDSNKEGAR